MKYTLFIDESGSFEKRQQWVVGGVLCRANAQRAQLHIRKALQHLPAKFNLDSSKDLHLTDLRKYLGLEGALKVVSAAFDSIASTEIDTHLVAAINESTEGLREPERTYRLMVLDLIALSATALTDTIKSFEVIIATRTRDGERMTTRSDIGKDIIGPLRDALEVDLVSRGVADSIRMGDVHMKSYNESWGLIPADFISNLVFNRSHSESKAVIDSLESEDRLRVFTSFAKHERRRALIAERDGDIALALKRWALLEATDDEEEQRQRSEALRRLCKRLLRSGTEGPRATIEAFLEGVWRDEALSLQQRHEAYRRTTAALKDVKEENPSAATPLLFRLRDQLHLLANRQGEIDEAQRLIKLQKSHVEDLALNPRYFHLALKSKVHTVTSRELMLDLEGGLLMAESHFKAVNKYRLAWELLGESEASPDGQEVFRFSRTYVKAAMTRIRARIFSTDPNYYSETLSLIDEIASYVRADKDHQRLRNYKILALLRNGKITAALDVAVEQLNAFPTDETPSTETLYHTGRAAAQAALRGRKLDRSKIASVYEHLLETADKDVSGHPHDLLWREIGLIEYELNDRKGDALRCFKRSTRALEALPDIPNAAWRRFLLKHHERHVNGTAKPLYKMHEQLRDHCFTPLVEAAIGQHPETIPLKALRTVSPV